MEISLGLFMPFRSGDKVKIKEDWYNMKYMSDNKEAFIELGYWEHVQGIVGQIFTISRVSTTAVELVEDWRMAHHKSIIEKVM